MNTAILWLQSLPPHLAVAVCVGICFFILLCVSMTCFFIGFCIGYKAGEEDDAYAASLLQGDELLANAEQETEQRPRVRAIH